MEDIRDFTGDLGGDGQPNEVRNDGQGLPSGEVTVQQPDGWLEEEWRQWNQGWWWFSSATAWAPRESNGVSWDPWSCWRGHRGFQPWSDGAWDHQPTGGDFSDPPQWSGWSHYRLWKRALVRWNSNTDVLLRRRSKKVLKSFDYDLQAKLDHISDQELQGAGYLNSIFAVLDILAGEKETSERRRVLRAALYEGPRRSDESLAQYALRREAQFMSATPFINIPDDLKAFMLEEQANLSKQSVQNLRVLTGGSSDFRQVLKALRVLDTDEEPIAKNKHSSYFEGDAHGSNYDHFDDDVSEEEFGLAESEVQGMLDSISQQDLEEDAAMSFVTDWEAKKKRSWSENRAMKNAKKKDRRHFDEPDSRPPKPAAHRGRLSIQELKKVTRCGNCSQK